MNLDKELKALSAHALQNAYFASLSTLLASYIAAADGLDIDPQMFYEVHGFASEPAQGIDIININDGVANYTTMAEALLSEQSNIWLNGVKVFERRDGEWFYAREA